MTVLSFPKAPDAFKAAHDASGAALQSDGGGGNYGDMEARVAKLEAIAENAQRDLGDIKSDVRELRRDARGDFRVIFGAIIAVALGLAGLMAKGFGWV